MLRKFIVICFVILSVVLTDKVNSVTNRSRGSASNLGIPVNPSLSSRQASGNPALDKLIVKFETGFTNFLRSVLKVLKKYSVE